MDCLFAGCPDDWILRREEENKHKSKKRRGWPSVLCDGSAVVNVIGQIKRQELGYACDLLPDAFRDHGIRDTEQPCDPAVCVPVDVIQQVRQRPQTPIRVIFRPPRRRL